jgi:hypothetical protein
MLKVLLREKHWQNYATFCTEYDKAARRIDPGIGGALNGPAPHIEQAFTAEHFAGFSGETLHGVIQEPLDKTRTGQVKPESVSIRMLLPDTSKPMAVPCRVEDLADDPDYRARMHPVTGRHAYAILETVQELAPLGRIKEASTEIRAYQVPPLFKLYLLKGEEAFFGLYPLVEHKIPFPDGSRAMYDLMGNDAVVFRHSVRSGDPTDAQFVEQAQGWFDSMWDHISYEFSALRVPGPTRRPSARSSPAPATCCSTSTARSMRDLPPHRRREAPPALSRRTARRDGEHAGPDRGVQLLGDRQRRNGRPRRGRDGRPRKSPPSPPPTRPRTCTRSSPAPSNPAGSSLSSATTAPARSTPT